MNVSIIIVNYRGWKRLRKCLESLRCLKEASFQWEVVIIDNYSNDGQLLLFQKEFEDFRFIENTGNYGFANGCNLGVRNSTGEFFLFLNPDTIVSLEAVHQLLTTAEANPEISIVTCQQIDERGKDTVPYGMFLRPATFTSFFRAMIRLVKSPLPVDTIAPGQQVTYPEWVSGSVILMNRKKFNDLNGWSEDFWMYYEDADLCKRVHDSGGKIALILNTQIIHNHGGASRVNNSIKALTKCEVLISRHVYIHKHFSGLSSVLMHSYLVLNNILLGHLFIFLISLVFAFLPALRAYPALYVNIVRYYLGAIRYRTWLSPRSVNFVNKK